MLETVLDDQSRFLIMDVHFPMVWTARFDVVDDLIETVAELQGLISVTPRHDGVFRMRLRVCGLSGLIQSRIRWGALIVRLAVFVLRIVRMSHVGPFVVDWQGDESGREFGLSA